MIGSNHHGRRIFGARLKVVQRRVAFQVLEHFLAVLARTVIACPVPTDSELMIAEHIHYTYLRNGYAKQIGTLCHTGTYQQTMVITADHDDRVVPAHSFKFAATLQECNDGTNPTIIRIESKAGHGAGKPMTKVLEVQADTYAFIMYNLGMKPKI